MFPRHLTIFRFKTTVAVILHNDFAFSDTQTIENTWQTLFH